MSWLQSRVRVTWSPHQCASSFFCVIVVFESLFTKWCVWCFLEVKFPLSLLPPSHFSDASPLGCNRSHLSSSTHILGSFSPLLIISSALLLLISSCSHVLIFSSPHLLCYSSSHLLSSPPPELIHYLWRLGHRSCFHSRVDLHLPLPPFSHLSSSCSSSPSSSSPASGWQTRTHKRTLSFIQPTLLATFFFHNIHNSWATVASRYDCVAVWLIRGENNVGPLRKTLRRTVSAGTGSEWASPAPSWLH